MKFLADMGISPKSVAFLNDLGHDAIHLRDERLERLPDHDVLRKARAEDRIVLTHDLDFGDLMAASHDSLPTVVIFRLRNMQPEHVNHRLAVLLENHSDALVSGNIISVAEGMIRLRSLPIDN